MSLCKSFLSPSSSRYGHIIKTKCFAVTVPVFFCFNFSFLLTIEWNRYVETNIQFTWRCCTLLCTHTHINKEETNRKTCKQTSKLKLFLVLGKKDLRTLLHLLTCYLLTYFKGFIKSTNHRPTNHLLTDPPTHRPTDPIITDPADKILFQRFDQWRIFVLQNSNTSGIM